MQLGSLLKRGEGEPVKEATQLGSLLKRGEGEPVKEATMQQGLPDHIWIKPKLSHAHFLTQRKRNVMDVDNSWPCSSLHRYIYTT